MLQRKSGIVWIAAYPRSGNTWARLFICNLAALLAGKREEENFNNFLRASPWDAEVKHYQKYIKLNPAGGEDAIRDMLSVRHLVLRDFAGTKRDMVFAKTHWLLDETFGHNTFDFSVTAAGAIYCVRNPLDVSISLAHHMGIPIDHAIEHMGTTFAITGDTIIDLLGSWSRNVHSWTKSPGPDIYVVRYEDLVEDPEIWFGAVARHIFDPAPSKEQIKEAIHRSSFGRLKAQEEAHGYFEYTDKTRRFFREGQLGQWKKVLTAPQIHRIIRDHGVVMSRFGYWPCE